MQTWKGAGGAPEGLQSARQIDPFATFPFHRAKHNKHGVVPCHPNYASGAKRRSISFGFADITNASVHIMLSGQGKCVESKLPFSDESTCRQEAIPAA